MPAFSDFPCCPACGDGTHFNRLTINTEEAYTEEGALDPRDKYLTTVTCPEGHIFLVKRWQIDVQRFYEIQLGAQVKLDDEDDD